MPRLTPVLLAASLLACTQSKSTPPPTPTTPPAETRAPLKAPECPMEVPGATPTAYMEGGTTGIDFTTDGDVETLREQVHKKVLVHQSHHIDAADFEPLDEAALAAADEARRQAMRARWNRRRLMSTATVEGVRLEKGMRVQMTPANPDEVSALAAITSDIARHLVEYGPRCPPDEQH